MNQSLILEILSDQKVEINNLMTQHFCARPEEKQINLSSKKAQVVMGVRRSGKSTLCLNALSKAGINFAYINFDDERLSDAKADDLNDILRCLYQVYGDFDHLFLDEAQNIDGWHLFVNRLLRQGLHIVITGSNAKLLSSELSTHLTGRYHLIELYPFSFAEFCEMRKIDMINLTTKADALRRRAFEEYLKIGGFPEIINGEENGEEYVDTLINDILHRDIEQRFRIRHREAFVKLANHLLNNAPCEIVYSSLQKQFNFRTDHTVENYIGYLYQAYMLMQLRKFSNKSLIRLRNSKCYAVDVSFLNFRKDAFAKENLGWRLENIVYIELRRRYPIGHDIYYFNDGSSETDFIVCHRAETISAIQVSYDISNPKTYNREIKGLLKAAQATKTTELKLITAYDEGVAEVNGYKIEIIPCYKWLLSARNPQ